MKPTTNSPVSQQEEELDLKKTVYVLLGYWPWILMFGLLGLLTAYGYGRLTKRNYAVSSTILIPLETAEFDMEELFDGTIDQDYTEIYNQIEILHSTITIRKALENLKWRSSWYKNETFVWNGLYGREPFVVEEPATASNPEGIKVSITPINSDYYSVSASGKLTLKGLETDIDFQEKGEFGHLFTNKYFSFTLQKKNLDFETYEGSYYFVFNNLKQMTLSYQQRLEVSLKDKFSDIVICSLAGNEPAQEVKFLNTLVEVYINQKMEFQNAAKRRSLDFIDSQLAGISDSLQLSGNEFTEFRSRNEILDLGSEGSLVMSKQKEIESEKAESQVQLDYFRNLLSYLEKSGDLAKLVSPSVVGIEDASLNRLVIKLGELYNRRQILSFTAKDNNPTLVMLGKELTQTRHQLNENLRNLIDNATTTINSIGDRQSAINQRLNKLPAQEQQLIKIQRQYDLTNDIYTFLLQRRAEMNIELASSLSDIQLIELASLETARQKGMSGKMILCMGLLLGLCIPVGGILLFQFFDSRILTQDDITQLTQLPVVGNIMHSADELELTVFSHPKSNIAESFRDLRTNLEFMLPGRQAKVISVHSTNPKEGKSYSSINLGTILAMNDYRVLLIGADLRKPKLHRIFELDNAHGLSNCLIGNDDFEQAVVATGIKNLSVLLSGPVPPNPAELLGRPAMRQLIEKARSQFDYIILDNAPVALVTDGIIVSRLSDLNIFILRVGMSHKHQLEMINNYQETEKVKHIALLVNDIKTSAYGKSFYKYYRYEAYKYAYAIDA